MMNDPKSTKDAPPDSPARETPPASETVPIGAFVNVYQKGVERLAEMQKNALDLVANQTLDAIGAWKQAVGGVTPAPAGFLWDLADQGVTKVVQAQKGMIDLAVQQTAKAVEVSKERREYATRWAKGVTDMMSETAGRTVAAHKIWLDFAAEQNKVVAAAMKRQAGFNGSTPAAEAVDTIQRNVEVAIQTQKELMDAATKPLKPAGPKQAAA
jgi:hypothetical protein